MNPIDPGDGPDGVAVIGMAGRFPGADDVSGFWRNIRDGVDCIDRFSVEELEVAGAAGLAQHPNYVKSRPILRRVDQFDPSFFGMLPREAELIDPQQRVFLECCWEALEDGGYDPQAYPGSIALYAGSSANTYFLHNLCVDRDFIEAYTGANQVGCYPTMLGANRDFLATRVSYKLGLRGPSLTVQSGCSTSLVAVCQACQGLLAYQSDMAMAGGVSITFPQRRGYFYDDGGMVSPDGRCRTLDADARGTVFGSGSGVVLLKRVADAVADGDQIYAVIRGYAVNNDGASKAGFTAPSVEGQARVIAEAHAVSGVDPGSIGYVELHGTATPLGDPIEFAALARAFRSRADGKNFCAVGSAKPNVGHLDIASGVTGLINAIQMLVHEQIPPLLHFRSPNPRIDLEDSPFYVNRSLARWETGTTPRRAGVSSFGVGGTNAHVVLEEAPSRSRPEGHPGPKLLVLSARTDSALEAATDRLADHLGSRTDLELDSVAFTLQAGRRPFEHRRFVVAESVEDARDALRGQDPGRRPTRRHDGLESPVVFMFPGQGSQYPNMGRDLYRTEAGFREDVDACSEMLAPHLGLDLRAVLFPDDRATDAPLGDLRETRLAQPSLFVIAYALARLWMRWGVRPTAMIGHSVGELVAATLAGVLSLEDSLEFIAARGRMMQGLPAGAMLSVRLAEEEVLPLLNGELSMAAINGPRHSVVSGPEEAINLLLRDMEGRGVGARRLRTSHAFHSRMMDPLVEPLRDFLGRFRFEAPKIPYISGVSGTWIGPDEATDPAYWARHFREPVQFARGIAELASEPRRIFLEVGPGHSLCQLARQRIDGARDQVAFPSLADGGTGRSGRRSLLDAAGHLWLRGAPIDWAEMNGPGGRRCSLPTYPFERQRCWVDPPRDATPPASPDHPRGAGDQRPPKDTSPMSDFDAESRPANPPAPTDGMRASIIRILEDQSGLRIVEGNTSTTFLEMGFDSLVLTQVAQMVQAEFGLKVTFRQLLNRESTVDSLAAYVAANLPPGSAPTRSTPPEVAPPSGRAQSQGDRPAPTEAVPPIPRPSVAGPSPFESIVREQIQAMSRLMEKQLEMLRGTPPPPLAIEEPRREPARSAPTAPPTVAANGPAARPEIRPFGPFKPNQPGQVGDLSGAQSRYLEDLIRRYTARTARSKENVQAHRGRLSDPRVASGFRAQWKELVYPIVTDRSRGSRLWDVDKNEYIDILNGYGAIMFGHAAGFVTSAVGDQLGMGFETGPLSPLAGRVADQLCDLTGMERAAFCNTGSEAVMAAIRVARTVTARKRIVLFAGSYHGNFDEVLVKGVRKGEEHLALPIAPGIPREMAAHATVLEYGTAESLEYIRAHANELAAVLVEPIQSRHPALRPVEFLETVRRITSSSGTALIFDEVVTGFRVHPGGAQAVFGIRADLATYGKVLGGGLPIGVLAGNSRFMDALDGGTWRFGDDSVPEVGVTFFAGTFVRHPLALAAASSVLAHLKEQGPGLQQALNEKTTRLVGAISSIFEERRVPARIEHFASVFYLAMPSDLRFAGLIYYHLRERGIHLQEGFPCFLTTAHTDADLDQIIRAFDDSLAEMQRGEALPTPSPKPSSPATGTMTGPPAAPGAIEETGLTESQVEIWLSARLGDEESCAFNESFTIHLRGRLDRSALLASVQGLVDRHSALRARFDEGGERQRFPDRLRIEIPTVDLSALPAMEAEAGLGRIIREDASEPFDLIGGPLVRARLVVLGADRHALLITSHHIVCDGWSTNILLDDLGALYRSALSCSPPDLGPASQFVDYARSQPERVAHPDREAVEGWWLECYRQPPPPLELPTDRPRGRQKSFRGATARAVIGVESYRRVKRFGAEKGCTLFVTLLSGFKILLHRLSNQADVVVGIPAAGQSLLEGPPPVGHCVNLLPLRSSFEDDPEVGEVLARVKTTTLDAYDHQDYTYGTLVRKLTIARDPSRLPLVEVQFNLERLGAGLSMPGLEAELDPNPKSFVNFDLFLNVVESDAGLLIDCDYNSDLLDRETVDRWLRVYETILGEMVDGPARRVSTLPLLTGDDRRRALTDGNDTSAEYPSDECVHRLFERQAARTPEAVAVVCRSESLTYAGLDAAADRIAGRLRDLGVGPGMPVGLCLERSVEMLVGLLGILKAGGAYLPLDPSYPPGRVSAVIHDSGIRWLLTREEVASRLGPMPAQMIRIDEAGRAPGRPGVLGADPSAADLAYLIYTSGSTGKPKGVAVSHRSAVNLLCSMARRPGLTSRDVLVAVTTLSFDIATLEMFLPLSVGARLVIATGEDTTDGHRLVALLGSAGATVLQATPATWRLLLEAGWPGHPGLKALCGGEALGRGLAKALLARTASLWNMYGPTETTIWSSALEVVPGTGPVPIGPPIANTEFHVLDGRREPVPVGVPGELYIGGDGVAEGYWGDPRLTVERFVEDPFRGNPGARLYRTGDLARRQVDGTFEFLGRLDSQVKVRGFRIETSEVESAILEYPGVRECVAIADDDASGEKRLVAYLAIEPAPSTADLRQFVASKLPGYMVPSIFVALDGLPRTPNGKVDRKRLATPAASAWTRDREVVGPRTPDEKVLVGICSEVLGVGRLDIHDSLFDLGADSIHVFQIVARAVEAGLGLSPKLIMTARTVASICAGVAGPKRESPARRELAPVPREECRVRRSFVN